MREVNLVTSFLTSIKVLYIVPERHILCMPFISRNENRKYYIFNAFPTDLMIYFVSFQFINSSTQIFYLFLNISVEKLSIQIRELFMKSFRFCFDIRA